MTPWPSTALRHVAVSIKDGTHGSYARVDEGYPLLSAKNIVGERVVVGESESLVSYESHREITRNGAFRPGDVLLTIVGTIGRAAILTSDGLAFQRSVCSIRPARALDARFLCKVVQGQGFQRELRARAKQSAQAGVYLGDVAAIPVPLPPLSIQRAIADFLDRKTAAIDALMEKKERLIALLQEKRQALITQAVTKGLDPDVPMKDSGIEWLGEIPAHWNVGPIRRWWSVLDCKHRTVPFLDEGVPVVSIGQLHGLEVDLSSANLTSEEEYAQMIQGGRKPEPGDIIYSRNATVGEAAEVLPGQWFCMGQDVALIRSDEQCSRFLLHQLRSPAVLRQLDAVMIGSTFRRINVSAIKALVVCVPPVREQRAIADTCDAEQRRLGDLAEAVTTHIALLREYRQAVITAAVTGKLDVTSEEAA